MEPLTLLNKVKLEGWQIIVFAILEMAAMYLWKKCKSLATTALQNLASKAWEDLRYMWKYKTCVKDFKIIQEELLARVKSIELDIEEAKKRNKTLVDPIVEHWLKRANKTLQQDTEPTKFFGLCTNYFSKIARAKELESLTKEMPTLISEVKKFPKEVAHATGAPDMELNLQEEFMSFESRNANFEELKKELHENNYILGLQGIGGTGKSTMAKEVWKHVEKSNAFDRVIFIKVSTPVDEKRIRDDIAKKLELQLEEEKLLTHAQQIWKKIADTGKVLIILDDVWEKLDLNNMGIRPGFHSKGRCCVLLTTRIQNVCTQMGCQKEIKLEDLDEKDALNLFLFHAIKTGHDCPDDLKNVAVDIVNECGRLPVIIVLVAKTLKDWHTKDWQYALITMKSADVPSGLGIVDKDAIKFYNSLKLSYNYLEDKQAQVLFLLSSIFPKAHHIPVELLSRIAIGLGLFGEVNKYYTARSQVCVKKNRLINFSLLLKAGEECLRMHDVIRDVALEIANKEIQVIMDSKTNLKENMIYSSWIINGFPNYFSDDSKLKVLLVWINADGSLNVPNTIFRRMKSLRVLLLHSKIEFGRTVALSLPESIQSLQDIRTLSLTNLELGDISVLMRNLHNLESLELNNCSTVELPKEISEQDTLRFLCLIRCLIEKNNPFEVIARCGQLEELYYVSNDDNMPLIGAKVPQIKSLTGYQKYHIDGSDFSPFDSSQLDASIKNVFKPGKLQRIFSKEIIKSLAARAEILELEGDDETASWNNLIPGIVSIEDGGAMKDLIKLSLMDWSEMKCLINTELLQLKSSRVTIFSKLAELQLFDVNVREICYGPYPEGFLKQLEKLELKECQNLEATLFKGKLELGSLKSIEIVNCSMTCLFHPSTAQSLRRLETLKMTGCSKLKCITRDEGSSIEEKVDLRNHDSLFPKLKLLSVQECEELEFILPICFCEDLPQLESVKIFFCHNLKYMFGEYPEQRGLHQMQKEITLPSLKGMSIEKVPSFVNIYPECYLPQKSAANASAGSKAKDKSPTGNVSWGRLCCFLPKSKATNKDEPSIRETTQPYYTPSQEKYVGNRAHGIFTPPLYPCNLREMNIGNILELRSLFSVSIASSMLLLEELVVSNCYELEHIVREEVYGDDHMNANSIFPNLRIIQIKGCDKLESVFPASCSTNLVHLESVLIYDASELKYVFGESCGDDNSPHQNHNTEIHLPDLNKLDLEQVPNMISMCPENYYVKALSLQGVTLSRCQQLPINSLIDLSVEGHKGQGQLSREKLMGMHLCNVKHLWLEDLEEMETIYDLQRLENIASPVKNSSLKSLSLESLPKLRNICVGPKNLHLSFQNLFKLKIEGCHKLKFIFCASISRCLPYLRLLEVQNCEEVERILEDDDEECCLPNLHRIIVQGCKRLECLFSISTCATLPQLSLLLIYDAPEMEQVFEWKQSATQEVHIMHVFPKLFVIGLEELPKLHTICSRIDFQTVIYRAIEDCPNISLTSTDTKFFERYMNWFRDSECNKGNMDKDDLNERVLNRAREVAEKIIKRDWPTKEPNNASSNIKGIAEASVEESPKSDEAIKADEVNDSEQSPKAAPFAAPSQIESPKETVKPTSQEGSQGKEVVMTDLSEIHVSENSKVEAQARKAELKDQISKLQAELAELYSKEKETEECEIKPLSLQEQKKKGVSDT